MTTWRFLLIWWGSSFSHAISGTQWIGTTMFCTYNLNGNHNVVSLTKSAQILLTKNIARKNRIESMCLRVWEDGFIYTTWELDYMAFATATQRKEDWPPRQTSKERELSATCLYKLHSSFGRWCCLHVLCVYSFQIPATTKGATNLDITNVQTASLPFIVAKTVRWRTGVQGTNECANALQMHLQHMKRPWPQLWERMKLYWRGHSDD